MSTITDSGEHAQQINVALSSLADDLDVGGLDFAALQAISELGWSYPLTNAKKVFWAIQRGKRHAIDLLRTVAASKFRYKQIYLNQRYENYTSLIKEWDKEFLEALNTEPVLIGSTVEKLFGTYINNGFIYDQYGNDITRLCNDNGIDNDGYRTRYCGSY